MTQATQIIARNVATLREAQGLTLGQLSKRSGIAKSSLSQVESGTSNPTVATLAALADALSTEIGNLLVEQADRTRVVVVRQGEGIDVSDEMIAGRLSESILVGASRIEFHSLEIRPGTDEVSPAHGIEAVEHVIVVSGNVEVGPVDIRTVLSTGDYARYPADAPHRWRSVSSEPARLWAIAVLPRFRDE